MAGFVCVASPVRSWGFPKCNNWRRDFQSEGYSQSGDTPWLINWNFEQHFILISPGYASARTNDGNVPHIDGNVQFPTTRSLIVRHTFWLHVPQNSKALSQLLIYVPDTVTVSNNIKNIDVLDENNHKINTNVFVNGKTILLAFLEPIAPNTKFYIDINNVVKRLNVGNGSVYRFFAQEVGINTETPIGVAWFRTY